jgi:type IX secretion system PorP/SprF family membrane protein
MIQIKKIILIAAVLLGSNIVVKAQYDPLFTQYMFNEMFINPAYAGSRDAISSTALYRDQWVGIEGAPKTETVTIHGPLSNKRVGLGLALMNETIGVEHKVGLFGTYAYRIMTSDEGRLAFGLQGGMINLKENYLDVVTHDKGDEQFSQNVQSFVPNAGFGIYYNTTKFYAGFSVPRLIDNYIDPSNGLEIRNKLNTKNWHYFLSSGYIFDVNEHVKLKPMCMIRASDGAPVQVDLTLAALFKETFWFGSTYRSGDAVAIFMQVNLTKQLRLGYSYDYTLTKLNNYGSGSHEITLGYDIPLVKTGVLTPRYF